MKERASLFGGGVTVARGERGGTVVRAALPRSSVVRHAEGACL
jgi:signal transduction histidine kinase